MYFAILIIFSIFLCHQCSAQGTVAFNSTLDIQVVAYSQFLNTLPKFEFPLVANYIYNTLNFPRQLHVVMESLGFASVIIIVGVFLICFVVGYFFAQICLCGKQKYDTCQKLSGRILSICVLISMVVCCSIGIFFFQTYYSTIYQGIDDTTTVVYEKRGTAVDIRTELKGLSKDIVSITIPPIVQSIENGTYTFDSYLSSVQSQSARAFEQWGPVTMFVIIMLVSIAGLMAVFFLKKIFVYYHSYLGWINVRLSHSSCSIWKCCINPIV